jgi:ankyrin repeat protein
MSLDEEELFQAIKMGDATRVRHLLLIGANVNARNIFGETPLHYAIERGKLDIIKLLLEHGADPNLKDNFGISPLDLAHAKKLFNIVELIKEYVEGKGNMEVEKNASVASPSEPTLAPSIVSVDSSSLNVGEWGRLIVKVKGTGTLNISLEGDLEWMSPKAIEISGESNLEIPVKPKLAGELPVKVTIRSKTGEDTQIVWLKVSRKTKRCPYCGAQVEPGAMFCWKCGAKLV